MDWCISSAGMTRDRYCGSASGSLLHSNRIRWKGTAAAEDLKTYTVRNYAALFSSPRALLHLVAEEIVRGQSHIGLGGFRRNVLTFPGLEPFLGRQKSQDDQDSMSRISSWPWREFHTTMGSVRAWLEMPSRGERNTDSLITMVQLHSSNLASTICRLAMQPPSARSITTPTFQQYDPTTYEWLGPRLRGINRWQVHLDCLV